MGSKLRRALALTTSLTLLTGLAVVTTGAPAAAQPPTCGGEVVTHPGTPGQDIIAGTPGPDVIHGYGGGDIIFGEGGDDIICGGGGEDYIDGGDGDDLIFGGPRKDTIRGEGGDDVICGDGGNDTLAGDLGVGADGADFIAGGPGRDTINGNGEGDVLSGYRSLLCPTQGRDVRDIIKGGPGGDTIRGGPGGDILNGNGGPDFIRGNTGSNTIDGGPADDDCRQGPRIRRCERADLAVRVLCPAEVVYEGGPGIVITCKVRVRNLGPNATTYSLEVGEQTNSGAANCSPLFPEGKRRFAALGRGRVRTKGYDILCASDPNSSEWVGAEVIADAYDRRKSNNKASDVIALP